MHIWNTCTPPANLAKFFLRQGFPRTNSGFSLLQFVHYTYTHAGAAKHMSANFLTSAPNGPASWVADAG